VQSDGKGGVRSPDETPAVTEPALSPGAP